MKQTHSLQPPGFPRFSAGAFRISIGQGWDEGSFVLLPRAFTLRKTCRESDLGEHPTLSVARLLGESLPPSGPTRLDFGLENATFHQLTGRLVKACDIEIILLSMIVRNPRHEMEAIVFVSPETERERLVFLNWDGENRMVETGERTWIVRRRKEDFSFLEKGLWEQIESFSDRLRNPGPLA